MRSYSNPITVSGNPATFTVQNAKALSLSVPIVPTQDLHGYSSPWPAGGGKNLFDVTDSVIRGYVSNAGKWIASAGNERSAISGLLQPGTYTISKISSSRFRVGIFDSKPTPNEDLNSSEFWTANPQTATSLTITTQTAGYLAIFMYNGSSEAHTADEIANSIQIESGSSATAWEPYSNICPITGRTGVTVYVSPTQNVADATTYTSDWTSPAGTVYGGTLDVVTGVLTVDRANIASYNGETITEPWLSSMDEYAPGATPTTGAQVVYTLATPLTYQLTAQEVELIKGLNNVWSDTNTTITLSYALLYFIRQKLIVNGTDLSEYVERDSYRTSLTPVYGQTIETLNGVQHTALLRLRGALKVGLNPQTDTDTATICTALLNTPCQVTYHCLQRDADVTSLMKVDPISAQFLSRCLFLGDEWNDIDDITLTEL